MFVYRLRFCADELSERREKRSAANALGLGADVDDDLAAGCAAIERKYLEAEEGMNAVLAAGAALRWEPVSARSGRLFPHLYLPALQRAAAIAHISLVREADGSFRFGERIPL